MTNDDEISAIRQRRLAELQNQYDQQLSSQLEEEQRAIAEDEENTRLNETMRKILTPEAKSRLVRVELAYQDLAKSVKMHLAVLHSEGRIATPINEESLKKILMGLQKNRRETTVRRL